MRKTIVVTLVLLYLLGIKEASAQGVVTKSAKESSLSSYPIPGSDLLWRQNQMVREYIKTHPNVMEEMRLAKATAWNFTVGSAHTWKSWNFGNSTFFSVPSTCCAVGTHCYIFVEDAQWGTKVTQDAVDSVRTAFDDKTPADPSKGIYQMDVDAFGDPPDVDGDPRIIILIMDIQDGYSGSGGYVAGYFGSTNEIPGLNSNSAEIYYLDCNPEDLGSHRGLVDGMSTTAHEFQHMIHFNYDQSEITFINEACSMVAEVNAGYPLYDQTGFTSEANHYLFDWRRDDMTAVLRDYSRATRYSLYLRDQFTMGIFKPLVQSPLHDTAGVNVALQAIGTSLRFSDVLKNWFMANIVNNKTDNSAYGYSYPGVTTVAPQLYFNPNVASTTRTVQRYAADYISFRAGSNLSATFTLPDNSSLLIKAVEKGSATPQVVDVAPGTPFNVPDFGGSISEVDFVIMNTNSTTNQDYTFQSSGTASVIEEKYDVTEPTGYLGNAEGDTVCVWFDGVPGAKLDSIRVALRRAGSMIGGVWRYTGNAPRPTPLGTPLAVPLTATVTATPGTPYPVPWPNWATIDLRAYNILADQPFAVAFRCDGVYSSSPRVMVTQVPTPSVVTSYTYSTNDSHGPNWYVYSSDEAHDTLFIYLIRAYVSFPSTGVSRSFELQPASFSLQQNYPNPFNPSTWIEYQIPSTQRVLVAVYDLLGRRVKTLVDGVQALGSYRIQWDGSDDAGRQVASGVYLYQLRTANFVQTNKMVLLK
jgi:hypothetical protein